MHSYMYVHTCVHVTCTCTTTCTCHMYMHNHMYMSHAWPHVCTYVHVPAGPNQALPSHCSYFTVSCDSLLNSCLLHCNGPCVPYSILANFNKPTQQLQDIKVMEVNPTLRDAIAPLDLPIEVPISVPATGLLAAVVGVVDDGDLSLPLRWPRAIWSDAPPPRL